MKGAWCSFAELDARFTEPEKAEVVVLPIPYELTSSYLQGTREAPAAILEASRQLELFDEETGEEPFRAGIYTCPPVSFTVDKPEQCLRVIEEEALGWIEKNRFLVSIGGEHTLTVGIVRALLRKHRGLNVVQLDAHADLRDTYEGSRWSHACTMRRVAELCPVVQVGIRSLSREEFDYAGRKGISIHFSHIIKAQRDWKEKVIEALGDSVYLTVDMDYFDPSLVPMVGTPEPGGPGWHETLDLLKMLAECRNVVGMDVVELCPKEGLVSSDFIAARLIYKFLAYRSHFNR